MCMMIPNCVGFFENNSYQTIHQNLSILETGRAKNINVSRLKMFLDTRVYNLGDKDASLEVAKLQ